MLRLVVGNLNYSSWSMRAWLALTVAGVEFKVHDVGIFTSPDWKDKVLSFSGAGKVPVLVDGALSIHESMAIVETIAERYPEAALWPAEPDLRARGRAISAEMASGFLLLRAEMPCNLRGRSHKRITDEGVLSEIARVLDIWEASLLTSSGDFLLGDFSIADCMFMPIVARFRTYGVEMNERAQAYCEAVLSHLAVVKLHEVAQGTVPVSAYDVML